MAKIIDGKIISSKLLDDLQKQVENLKKEQQIHPCLAVILVGNDAGSRVYVNNKKKACEKIGIRSLEYLLPEDTTQQELIALIDELNNNDEVNGILCQLPIPPHLDEKAVINRISPAKDVDAFHPANVGHIMIGDYTILPCTPSGVMEMLHHEHIDVAGKHCVVIGRSNIVGKPMALLLLHENATVTICHSKTENLAAITRQADILISAVGKEKFVTAAMVKKDAVVVDVAMNRNKDNKLCGDVDFDAVKEIASYITPVPGGVGLMTVATLMKNTINVAINQKNVN